MIELIVLDVDGCLTNGSISYCEDQEIKNFNVKDGLAISSWIRLGKQVAIITGRESVAVKKRADELKVQFLFQKEKKKLKSLDYILKDLSLSYENVAVIGDDLNDYQIIQNAKLSFTPNDGADEIKKIADITLKSKGGEGAVREMIDSIIEKEGLSKRYLALWT